MRTIKIDVSNRQGYIGGSSVGAIVDCSQSYKTEYQVYEQFAKGINRPVDDRQQKILDYGHLLEPVIASKAAQMFGFEYEDTTEDFAWQHDDYDWAICHPDRVCKGGKVAVEIKSFGENSLNKWDVKGTFGVPFDYECQCMWYFAVNKELETLHLVAMCKATGDIKHYKFERDEVAIYADSVLNIVVNWVNRVNQGYIPDKINDDDYKSFVNNINASDDYKVADIDDQINYYTYRSVTYLMNRLEDYQKILKRRLIDSFAGYKALTHEGKKICSIVKMNKTMFNKDKFQKEHQALYDEYTYSITEQQTRMLQLKQAELEKSRESDAETLKQLKQAKECYLKELEDGISESESESESEQQRIGIEEAREQEDCSSES